MERTIASLRRDREGEWVAELDCGHCQHVRHRPPFQVRPWVLDEPQRAERVGTVLPCPLCARAEMPERVRFVRASAPWDERSLPAGLLRAHRLASGTWGRLVVEEGRVAFRAATTPPTECVLRAGSTQAIPPGLTHEIEPIGHVRLFVEFFDVATQDACEGTGSSRGEGAEADPGETWGSEEDAGGDPACWAHLLCPECGGLSRDGHAPGCSLADQEP